MSNLTQEQAQQAYKNGSVLVNTSNNSGHNPIIFKLAGKDYTTNRKRARQGKRYNNLDNPHWSIHYKSGLLYKLLAVYNKTAYKIKD